MNGQWLFVQCLIFPHNVSSFPHPILIMAGDKAVLPVTQAPSHCMSWDLAELWLLKSQCFFISDFSSSQPFPAMPTGKPLLQAPPFSHSDPCRFLSIALEKFSPTHRLQKVILQPGLPLTFPFPHWHLFLRYWTSVSCLGSLGTAWPAPNLLPQLPLLPARLPSFLVHFSNKNLYAFFHRP